MTIDERNAKLKAFITCLKCEVSGRVCNPECSTQYDAGNMGEIIENLDAISKVLDTKTVTIKRLSPDQIERIKQIYKSGTTHCVQYIKPDNSET